MCGIEITRLIGEHTKIEHRLRLIAFGDHELVIVDAIEEVRAAEVGDLPSLGAALDQPAEAGVTALPRVR